MNFSAGTYGQLDRAGNIVGVYNAPTDFEGRSGCFLPIIVDAQPTFDPATQKLSSSYAIVNGEFHQTWSVVALSDSELWENFHASDWVDPVTSIRLKTTDNAMNYFTAQATLLSTALGAGVITQSTQVQIWDSSGNPHSLAVSDMLGLLLRYGFNYQTAYASFAP